MKCQQDLFNLHRDVHYLNCAYMSPLLKSVEEAGITGIRKKRNPFEVTPDDFFNNTEKIRTEFAKLVNSSSPERMVIIPSVSYGIATVAANIPFDEKSKVIVAGEQFPSNYYTWKNKAERENGELKVVAKPVSGNSAADWNDEIIGGIDHRTAAVSISHTHWADGTLFDLIRIRERCDEVGALLIVDGTQSVGALNFDMGKIRPDTLICAGYKWLMGPYSIGIAYIGEKFDKGIPLEENWINRLHSEDFSGLVDYEDRYHSGALRYEVGEHSNFILIPMFLRALQQLNQWGIDPIYRYIDEITSGAIEELINMGFILNSPDYRSPHLFGIRHPQINPGEISRLLQREKVYVSVRGKSIRVSVNVFNHKSNLDALVRVGRYALQV